MSTSETKPAGILAEFADAPALIAAARAMRVRGHRRLDAHTPFPIHELDDALGIRPSVLPWLALGAGICGGAVALAGQWWTNAIDYAYIISGKPLFSWQANLPVTFEFIILSAAITVFFGMLLLVGLPRLANPIFGSKRFSKVTTDGFFLWLGADTGEDKFEADELSASLSELGATGVETIEADTAAAPMPKAVFAALALVVVVALIPPLWIARSRATTSRTPPLRSFKDMDFQPKFKAQTTTNLFADGRAMRPPIPGTVARGELQDDDHFYRGLQPEVPGRRFTSISLETAEASSEAREANESGRLPRSDSPQPPGPAWATTFPVEVTSELMRRGRQRYNIHCATCHGRAGDGNGPVSVRALALEQGTWVPPTSIHAQHVREQPVGKLFNTITNGVRKMPGYGAQIKPEDRWAIVLYIRGLQRSRNASPADVPAADLPKLRELN